MGVCRVLFTGMTVMMVRLLLRVIRYARRNRVKRVVFRFGRLEKFTSINFIIS